MPRFYVTITEVFTNWKRLEMDAESPEELQRRIVDCGDYDPEAIEPRTLEVTASDIVLVEPNGEPN
jgi:hypothetical protein